LRVAAVRAVARMPGIGAADPLEQRNIAGSAPDVEARLADLINSECREFAYGTEGDS